jgi:hypothetical protein
VVVFSFHRWYRESIDEDDRWGVEAEAETIPRVLRRKWLQQLRHHKVHAAVCAAPLPPIPPSRGRKVQRPFPSIAAIPSPLSLTRAEEEREEEERRIAGGKCSEPVVKR